jgi:hypothetical protein
MAEGVRSLGDQADPQFVRLVEAQDAEIVLSGQTLGVGVRAVLELRSAQGSTTADQAPVTLHFPSANDAIFAAENLERAGSRALNRELGLAADADNPIGRYAESVETRGDSARQEVVLKFNLLPLRPAEWGPNATTSSTMVVLDVELAHALVGHIMRIFGWEPPDNTEREPG